MTFSHRWTYNGRSTIGRSNMAYHWLDLNIGRPTIGWFFNSKQERVRLVGFKYQKADDWLDLNSKQEGLRLVGIKYQKGYDWLDSKFHCSYIESRGVPGKKNAGSTGEKREKLSPFHFRSGSRLPVMQRPVISGDATSGDVTAPPQMRLGLCLHTTHANKTTKKCIQFLNELCAS